MRFTVVLAMMMCFLAFSVSAQIKTFDASVTPVVDQIALDEAAVFDIEITNSYAEEREFKIHKSGYPFWDMYVQPLSNPITVTIAPDSKKTIRLYVRPLHVSGIDTYNVDTQVEDLKTGRMQRVPMTVSIGRADNLIGGYVPTIIASLKVPKSIDPRNSYSMELSLDNQNLLDYPDLTVKVSSDLFNAEHHYTLGPKETKVVAIPLVLDENTPPQTQTITVRIFREDKEVTQPRTGTTRIEQYVIESPVEVQGRLLKTSYTYTVDSNNPSYTGQVKIPITYLQNIFSTTSPDATMIVESGQRYYVWDVSLAQGGSVRMTENYRPAVIIAIILVVLLTLYYVFRSPLILVKEIASVSGRQGGVTEVKVVLKLRNRGKDALHEIEIGDVIPKIAGIKKELTIGALQPHKITRSHSKGTIVKWVVESLEPNESVVLSYRMHSRIAILGEFVLPVSTARFKSRNSYIITNSNRPTVTE